MMYSGYLPRVFVARYQKLAAWNVAAQFATSWKWPDEIIKPLGWVLTRRSEAASDTLTPESLVNLLTIRFDGSIEPREPVHIKGIKGKLFRVYPGDVVFSKIDVRNGAIGLAPIDIDFMCVTSEFPIYYANTENILAKYIKLLFRTSAFKKLLNSMISGTSGRKRILPSQLEATRVPIPPLPIQKKIVDYWENKLSHQQRLLSKEDETRRQSQTFMSQALGIKRVVPKHIGKVFPLNWSNSERWSYEFNKRVLSGLAQVKTGQYKTVPLGKLCVGRSGSTPSKKNPLFWKNGEVLWVSPKDMKTREISHTIDHITKMAVKDHQAPMIAKGSILFVVRSGILQKTVPVAVTRERVSINQDIRSFTPRNGDILPDYLLAYFEAKQEDLLRLVKWSTTVQSINKEELESFPVPVPPIENQKKIVSSINEFQTEINNCQAEYEKSILSSTFAVEQMILGRLSVEDVFKRNQT